MAAAIDRKIFFREDLCLQVELPIAALSAGNSFFFTVSGFHFPGDRMYFFGSMHICLSALSCPVFGRYLSLSALS